MMRRAGLAAALCVALLAPAAPAETDEAQAADTSRAQPDEAQAADASRAQPDAADPDAGRAPETPQSFHRQLLERVRAHADAEAQRDREREERFRRAKEEQAETLKGLEAQVARAEAESQTLDTRYGENEHELGRRSDRLAERLGQMGELYGVVRLVATDLSSETWDSLTSAGLRARGEVLDRLGRSKGLPSTSDMERLWYELLREMAEQGRVATYTAPVLLDGDASEDRRVTRAGPFTAVYDGGYLEWEADEQSLRAPDRQPPPRYLNTVASYLNGGGYDGVRLLAVDPSRGKLLDALTDTPSLGERIDQGGAIGYTIVVLGVFALLLGAARLVKLTQIGRRVAAQQAQDDRPSDDNPLGRVLSVYEANRSAARATLELKLDDAVLRESRQVAAQLWIVQSTSVIAPLLGLLGTVTGMIQTFQAITLYGTGDPKMMAGGISEALVTTLLGLVIAAPLVVLYALLAARARSITDVLDQRVAALVADRLENGKGMAAAGASPNQVASASVAEPADPVDPQATTAGPDRPVRRYASAIALGAVATFGLFWTMQALINVGYKLAEGGSQLSVDFVRLKRDTAPPEPKREPPKREKPEQPPPPPDISRSRANLDPGQEVVAIASLVEPTGGIEAGIGGTGGSDRDVIPLVRTEPQYPAQAAARGLTGWVTVQFTVAKTGAVRDPVVLAAQPPRIFNQAALAAVRRWKYNPKIESGQAVERPNMQITFEFRP